MVIRPMKKVQRTSKKVKQPTVREATPEDCAAIAAIYNQSVLAGAITADTKPKTAGDFAHLAGGFSDRQGILVLEVSDRLIGYGVLKHYSSRPGYRTTGETGVYLHLEETGKGYGPLLKKVLIQRCKRLGYHHLVAKITAGNLASIEYNKKLGFQMVGTQKEVLYLDGRWQDVVIMQLILPDVPAP